MRGHEPGSRNSPFDDDMWGDRASADFGEGGPGLAVDDAAIARARNPEEIDEHVVKG
jgi:hypothetical protein